MAITLNEKTCLSVSRRRLCPKERGDFLEKRAVRPAESSSQEAQIRTLLDKQKVQILAECQARINRHEFQAAYDRRSLLKLGEIVASQQEELHFARAEEVQQRDQQLLQGQLLQQNLELREAHQKSLTEMEELKKFQSSTFDTIARRKLIEDQECNSSKAQVWTLLEEQRQTVLAECNARVSHYELQAAQAEEERRLLQGQLWQQKLEFREAHQRSLAEMEESRKFQSSAFDTMARRKFIEDQNTILELGQGVQELQNEVNCMNDFKDFQEAESVRSGNSHVTSRPVSFPPHPIPEGMLSRPLGGPWSTL